MSSVTQVKFEIKPSARKSANTGRSIGNVASSGVKQNTIGVKRLDGNNYDTKQESSGSIDKAENKVNAGKVLKSDTVAVKDKVKVDSAVKRNESQRAVGIAADSGAKQSETELKVKPAQAAQRNSKPVVKSDSVKKENEVVKKFGGNVSPLSSRDNVARNLGHSGNSLQTREDSLKKAKTVGHVTYEHVKDKPGIAVSVNTGGFAGSSLKLGKTSSESKSSLHSADNVSKITSSKDAKLSTNPVLLSGGVKEQNVTATFNNKAGVKRDTTVGSGSKLNTKNEVESSNTAITIEKKITNPEREKMLAQALKEEIIRKGNDLSSGKGLTSKGPTMDQEKKIDLGEEPSVGDNVVEISIKDDEPDEPVKVVEPANMIDELQKYLLKRFGPVVKSNIQESQETSKFDVKESIKNSIINDNSRQTENQAKPELIVKTDADEGQAVVKKAPISPDAFLPHPIFFKTSIKKDPGSKLHDQLLKELGSVLRKKDGKEDTSKTSDKENEKEDDDNEKGRVKFPKRRVSAKGNKILGNKALLANLENQLQRTLHKNKIFQRQKLKVVDLETIEVKDSERHSVSSTENDDKAEAVGKSGAKLILDSEKLHKTDDDNVTSAINQLDMSINEHSEGSSQKVSRLHPELASSPAAKADGIDESEHQEIFVYAFENKSGKTEGVVCSVEKRQSTSDSLGRPRKYLTCINILAEKEAVLDEGCPFTQDIADGGLPSASGSGLFFAEEDKPANFNVEVGRRKGDLRVSVSGPNSIAKCSVDPQADGSYTVTYIPVETGIFDISVTWNGTDIPGSPYHPKVIDARKVRIIGGWQHFMDSNERVNLVVGERKQLPFDIAEAGPGTLRAEVKGPSRSLDVDIDNHTMGKCVVEFVPEEEGAHYIHLFWSDIPLVNSPYLGFAIQHTPDASKIILTGRGLKEAVVREEAEFIIDGSQAGRGTPDVVLSGVRAEVNVRVGSIGNGKFRCSYIPILPGAYLLHITWNGRQLRGSPYKVNVIGAFYPNRVAVSGVGGAILGRDMFIGIDTRKAGPGELTAYCMGPHQVAYCELEDNHDGTFRLGVKAQESGRHVLQIKYGGEHVQGSPFVYKVTAQPDASKVRVHGPGVEHGILATYISRFIVETRGAGSGQLTVRIRGPKGAFQVEMYRDSQRDRTILCRFDPTECGLYIISVKWSGVDVPGSPFHVHILDTQEELEQVLNDVSYSFGTSQSHSHGGSQHSQQNPPRIVYGQWQQQI